jgi:hypothetical protein
LVLWESQFFRNLLILRSAESGKNVGKVRFSGKTQLRIPGEKFEDFSNGVRRALYVATVFTAWINLELAPRNLRKANLLHWKRLALRRFLPRTSDSTKNAL